MNYLVTGATSGVGKRCATRLLDSGNNCTLLARNKEELKKFEIKYGDSVKCICVDLGDLHSIESAILDNISVPYDGFIHCAGVAPLSSVTENMIDDVEHTYKVNVLSFAEVMRCLCASSNIGEGASVVSISSVAAHRGSNRQSVYSGTKAALEAASRSMAKELLPQGIRVNTVVCGAIDTEMLDKLRLESPNLDDRLKTYYPLGVIPIDEVCSMIEYLLSDSAKHITGASMNIDSGYLL